MAIRVYDNVDHVIVSDLILNLKVIVRDDDMKWDKESLIDMVERLKEETHEVYNKYFHFNSKLEIKVRNGQVELLFSEEGGNNIGTICKDGLNNSLIDIVSKKYGIKINRCVKYIIMRKLKYIIASSLSDTDLDNLNVSRDSACKPVHITRQRIPELFRYLGVEPVKGS